MAALAVALLGALVACGDEPSSFGAAHVTSSATHARATEAEASAGAPIVRRVATELYPPLAADAGQGNLAYSPLSIAVALGMTRAGAEGETADQLDALFGVDDATDVDGTGTSLHRAINGIDETIGSFAGPSPTDEDPEARIDVESASSLWGQVGWTWEDPFVDQLKTAYDASMWGVDYQRDPDRARAEVNDWVASRTNERITDLIPDGVFTDRTRLTLVNAIWFAAPWQERLDDLGDRPFTTLEGAEVEVPMVGDVTEVVATEGDGWRAVTLPYVRGDLAMTMVVPDAGELAAVEGALAEVLDAALAPGEPAFVDLAFPKIDLDQRAKLKPALASVGVTAPFEAGTTDLAPMTAQGQLFLSDALHQATVIVDEEGTEAAAATAAVFEDVSAPLVEEELVVDRPYLFVIHDTATGTPLFLGRVADPTAS